MFNLSPSLLNFALMESKTFFSQQNISGGSQQNCDSTEQTTEVDEDLKKKKKQPKQT